ncbi:MAG: hypothetical protein DRJ50_14540, partial [Actinobacteria bacterium]
GYDLRGAIFREAELCDGAGICMGLVLEGCSTDEGPNWCTLLEGADFSNSNVSLFDFEGIDLTRTSFNQSTLCDSDSCANFNDANLFEASFNGVDFGETGFQGVFEGTQAFDDCTASLQQQKNCFSCAASVQRVTLGAITDPDSGVILQTNLEGLDLSGVDLSEANLSQANLARVTFANITDSDPRGFDDPAIVTDTRFASSDLTQVAIWVLGVDEGGEMRLQIATDSSDDYVEGHPRLDDTILTAASLVGLSLDSKVVVDPNTGADVVEKSSVDLSGARVTGTDFTNAKLNGAILTSLDLEEHCITVQEDGVDIKKCLTFNGASLNGLPVGDDSEGNPQDPVVTDLRGTDFTLYVDPDADGADLFQNIAGKDLSYTALAGSRLDGMNLSEINFQNIQAAGFGGIFCDEGEDPESEDGLGCAVLSDADFTNADLRSATLTTAGLAETNFTEADLSGAQLNFMSVEDFCTNVVDGTCSEENGGKIINLTGADLAGVSMRESPGLSVLPSDFFRESRIAVVGDDGDEPTYFDLRGVDFSENDLTGIDLSCKVVQIADGEPCASEPDVSCSMKTDPLCQPKGFDLTSSSFTNTDLTCADLNESILIGSLRELCTEDDECADLRSSDFSGTSLLGVDFRDVPITGANFSRAILRGSVFDGIGDDDTGTDDDPCYSEGDGPNPAPSCHAGGSCLNFEDAELAGVSMQFIDFTNFVDLDGDPAIDFRGRDLSGADFSFSRFSGFDLTAADLTLADLSGVDFSGLVIVSDEGEETLQQTDLSEATFNRADFALGATTNPDGSCTLPGSDAPTDLRGANLVGADFSDSIHFAEGCIDVDKTTTYDSGSTEFPDLFTLQAEMTNVPEPGAALLQAAALGALSLRARRQRRSPRR